jgi:hypothetical protein
MEETIKIKCECGSECERPQKYKEYQEKSPNVIWKWKLMYCDTCYKNRCDKALKRLPEVLNAMINDAKSDGKEKIN